jgi:hypothetical protein
MNGSALSRYKSPLLIVSTLLLVWAVLGALDVRNYADNGYATDGNNTITQVVEGGPADRAGFEVGDYIRSVGGISVEDSRAAARRGRPEVGEVREFEVERDGRSVNLELTYATQSANDMIANYGIVVIGLLFLVFGVWAFVQAPSGTTVLLALLGLSFAPAFTGGPYFSSLAWRTAVGIIGLLLIVIGFAVMTHFIIVFPKAKRALDKRSTVWLIYGPAVAVGLLSLWLLVFLPPATSAVNVFFRAVFGLFLVAYFGTCLIALIRGYVKSTPQARTANGLNLVLLGAVVGLGPSLIISLVGLIAPQVVVPGAQIVPLGIALIPVTFAIAAVRGERVAQAAA